LWRLVFVVDSDFSAIIGVGKALVQVTKSDIQKYRRAVANAVLGRFVRFTDFQRGNAT
jgi:hypothetical protein